MSFSGRIFDISLALILAVFLIVPSVLIAMLILVLDGRPVFFSNRTA